MRPPHSTHSGLPQSENSASVEDLKNKVTRLMEQMEHHTRSLNTFVPMQDKIDIVEGQLEYWQQRLPRRSLAKALEETQSSLELQEEF